MSENVVSVSLLEGGTTVSLERGASISDDLWLQIRAEWSTEIRGASATLVIPLESFLARRAAFGALIQRHKARAQLDEGLRALVVQANGDQASLREALSGIAALDAAALEQRLEGGRFNRDLRGFQERDLGHLLALSHGANFSVPGAGKTTVAYAAYEAERLAGRVGRLLVIAPLSAFGAWMDEAVDCFSGSPIVHRFEGDAIPADTEVLLVNYQRLNTGFDQLAQWVTAEPTMVILDEAHRMKKGWGGQWGTACLNLAYLAQRRDILTGTPAPQGPRDFVALLDFLWPAQARRILPADATVIRPPDGTQQRVAQAIRPLFVRTTKGDLKLPKVDRNAIVVPLEGVQRDIYLALKDRYAGTFTLGVDNRRNLAAMGQVTMYLLEAATNPKLLAAGSLEGADPDVFRHPPLEIEEGSELAELIASYNRHETAAKFIELGRLVEDNASKGRKTLVWSNFVRNLKLLERQLSGLHPALIHGGVPAFAPDGKPSRERAIDAFRNDPECFVLLANPAAMSEGISLHKECHDAVYLERTFNAGQFLQSIDRIHRLGLLPGTKTRITFLLTAETIDMTVDDRLRTKAAGLGTMLDDPNLAAVALPDDEDYGAPLDDALDVEALFKHLRGDDE